MSADVGAPEPRELEGYEQNVTYNLSAIFRKAFEETPYQENGFSSLDGETGAQARMFVESARQELENFPEKFRELEPSNKWGTVETAIDVLKTLEKWCHEAPKGIIKIS